ncbi:MAG: A24 family peptidase [Lachnospiraceae bacterium]|nr:A24 family peptidase [Lachnospiraceae bacterium]
MIACNYIIVFLLGMAVGRFTGMKSRLYGDTPVAYPVTEVLTGILWCLTFLIVGWKWEAVFVCLLIPALIVASATDRRMLKIPFGVNVFIFAIGLMQLVYVLYSDMVLKGAAGIARGQWYEYVTGFFAVSVPMYFIFAITKGHGIGGGDIKLMAAAGLLIGWKYAILALLAGGLYAGISHIVRMKISGEGRTFAMGPYLSAGILTAVWFGEEIIEWYLSY